MNILIKLQRNFYENNWLDFNPLSTELPSTHENTVMLEGEKDLDFLALKGIKLISTW